MKTILSSIFLVFLFIYPALAIAQTVCFGHFHDYNGDCEPNDNNNCGEHGKVCDTSKVSNSSEVSCEFGICEATVCNHGYHPYSGICEANDNSNCGKHGNICNTSKIDSSKAVNCVSGLCKPIICISGYHVDNGKCIRTSKDAQKEAENAQTGCFGHFHDYNGDCEPNDNNNCGEHGKVCDTSKVSNSSEVSCEFGICEATACKSSYHLYKDNGQCKPNDNNNCGEHGKVCDTSKVSNSSMVRCNYGICEATVCNHGYHPYSGICEANDNSNCGKHGNICNTSKIDGSKAVNCVSDNCEAIECSSGYHLNNGICEANDNSNCGKHGNVCHVDNGASECQNASCVVTGCNRGYHLVNGNCEFDNTGKIIGWSIFGGSVVLMGTALLVGCFSELENNWKVVVGLSATSAILLSMSIVVLLSSRTPKTQSNAHNNTIQWSPNLVVTKDYQGIGVNIVF